MDKSLKRKRRHERLSEALPTDEELAYRLRAAVENLRGPVASLLVTDRRVNTYYSSHPSEVVSCRIDGGAYRLLVKYGTPGAYLTHLSRAGVEYEAEVYRRILHPLQVSTPPLMGVLELEETGATWLAVEYLDNCLRLDDLETAVIDAASWLGRFHAQMAASCSTEALPFLKVYTAEYFDYWVDAVTIRVAPLMDRIPMLGDLLASIRQQFLRLLDRPLVMIHGEFYPHNILVRDGGIYPIDWETAAFGLAEIDFSSLTDGWEPEIKKACRDAYVQERWNGDEPGEFSRDLLLADMYWNVRWLSGVGKKHQPPLNASETEQVPPRVKQLAAICRSLESDFET